MPITTDRLRLKIVEKVRQLRLRNRWTQAQLSDLLGLSQNRLSEIEHGQGSFTAEQLLVVLKTFNAPISEFVESKSDNQAKLQNALARLGAKHLQESRDVLPTERLENIHAVIREVLVGAESSRQITALAPVIVNHATHLNLNKLKLQLFGAGYVQRLGWLLENVYDAVREGGGWQKPVSKIWAENYAVAESVLIDALHRVKPPADDEEDVLEPEILRSPKTLEEVRKSRSVISKRWHIVSRIQPDDFIQALRSARGSH